MRSKTIAMAKTPGHPIFGSVNLAENGVHTHDFHATILALLGLDHEKLTYRHAGRDYRLTDVHGHVVQDLLV